MTIEKEAILLLKILFPSQHKRKYDLIKCFGRAANGRMGVRFMHKFKLKKTISKISFVVGMVFATTLFIAKKKRSDSHYDNEPRQKNALEGKKVIFVNDENDNINADGLKGHLEAVGTADHHLKFYEKYVKRGLDVVLSFAGLLVLSPLLGIVSLAIVIDDPGPVLFTQKRLGQNKKYFKMHKFRSMKMCTPHDVPTHQLDNPDQYITRVGKFMRRHSIDELPQIWDIFVGNMSIIGPRPALWNQDVLIAERDKYGANDVKPGLTGWAQINGRDELDIATKARLDGEYVKKMGLLMDIRCFLGSVGVFGGDDSVVEGSKKTLRKENQLLPIAVCQKNLDFSCPKKILIAGSGSYIGEMFKTYLLQYGNYTVETFETVSDSWKMLNFSGYDAVYDVAGIAHIKETKKNRHLFYQVNRDLAVELAKKAKKEGVKQFIYLSSMSVYGVIDGVIDEQASINPTSAYGRSKAEAEQLLWQLNDENFIVSIVRPPMVYGKGCKGNYQWLRKYALKIGYFPEYYNNRSMIYIDNLSSAVRGIIHNEQSGVYFPQNKEYICTCDMIQKIAEANGKKIICNKFLNPVVELVAKRVNVCKKVFGSLTYVQDMNVPTLWIDVKRNATTYEMSEGIKMDNTMPLVTVLTVAFNSEKTIARTIEAVLNQTYSNIEYIIIDGASTDKTVEIAESYKEAFALSQGKTLFIVSEQDRGMYDALNKGAQLAKGELVGQINADDWYESDAVETMVNLYKETCYDVAWGSIRVHKPSGETIKHARIGKLWTTSGWCHPAMFSKTKVLLEHPYICESMYDDFDFITAMHKAGKKIITTDHLISNFSFGGMSTKKDLSEVKKRVDILYKVYRRYGMSRLYYIQRWGVEFLKFLLG